MGGLKDHMAGALYGVAVGDALGAPLEFMSAEEIEHRHGYVDKMIGGGWLNVRPGETTDDTAMTLAVAEGIMESPDDPIPSIGQRFIQWAKSDPKDIGATCHCAISKAASGSCKRPSSFRWENAAKETAIINKGRSAGNGALMRAVYPAIYYRKSGTATHVSLWQGRMTHWDSQSDEACSLYAEVLHYLMVEATNDRDDDDGHVCQWIERRLAKTKYNLDDIVKDGRAGKLKPTGYVVDSLKCALYAFCDGGDTFEAAVACAANMGGDADTIAAICGGLAGAYYGFDAIPRDWVEALSQADRQRLDAAVEAALDYWATGS